MFSFLREAPGADGKPGPLSMRRLAAAACIITSIVSGMLALIIIYRFIGKNPDATLDWKAFIPLFIPCLAFLVGTLALLFFTTWEDIKAVVHAAAEFKKGQTMKNALFFSIVILVAVCGGGCKTTGAVPETSGLAGEYRDIEREVQSGQTELAATG